MIAGKSSLASLGNSPSIIRTSIDHPVVFVPWPSFESVLTNQRGFWIGVALILLVYFRTRTWFGDTRVLIVIGLHESLQYPGSPAERFYRIKRDRSAERSVSTGEQRTWCLLLHPANASAGMARPETPAVGVSSRSCRVISALKK
jgi:hypothetical protein